MKLFNFLLIIMLSVQSHLVTAFAESNAQNNLSPFEETSKTKVKDMSGETNQSEDKVDVKKQDATPFKSGKSNQKTKKDTAIKSNDAFVNDVSEEAGEKKDGSPEPNESVDKISDEDHYFDTPFGRIKKKIN